MTVGSLFTLVIVLVAIAILVGAAFYAMDNLFPTSPLNRMIKVVIVVIAALVLVAALLSFAGINTGMSVGS
jgi:hypothetical protein